MSYQHTKIGKIQLSDEERLEMIASLRDAFYKIHLKLLSSPCVYRGSKLWYNCSTCNGWKDGCTARLPEELFKDEHGRWRKDIL